MGFDLRTAQQFQQPDTVDDTRSAADTNDETLCSQWLCLFCWLETLVFEHSILEHSKYVILYVILYVITMLFYGMSSATAMAKHSGGVADYRASEGKTVEVPYRGPVESTVKDILGGVRSARTYVGARQLWELTKRTTFIQVMEQHNPTYD